MVIVQSAGTGHTNYRRSCLIAHGRPYFGRSCENTRPVRSDESFRAVVDHVFYITITRYGRSRAGTAALGLYHGGVSVSVEMAVL